MEGTVLSEGRGTVRPFETLRSPPAAGAYPCQERSIRLCRQGGCELFRLRPHTFVPTFEKWQGQNCHGYQVHVAKFRRGTDVGQLEGRADCTAGIISSYGDWIFGWRPPPFENTKMIAMPIDILNGTDYAAIVD